MNPHPRISFPLIFRESRREGLRRDRTASTLLCGLGSCLWICSLLCKMERYPPASGLMGCRSSLKALEISLLCKGERSVDLGLECWLLGEEREGGRERKRQNKCLLTVSKSRA